MWVTSSLRLCRTKRREGISHSVCNHACKQILTPKRHCLCFSCKLLPFRFVKTHTHSMRSHKQNHTHFVAHTKIHIKYSIKRIRPSAPILKHRTSFSVKRVKESANVETYSILSPDISFVLIYLVLSVTHSHLCSNEAFLARLKE